MTTYHLDLLEKYLSRAMELYCELCESSTERKYLSNETLLLQTREIIHQYLSLFQTLHFLDKETVYYRKGFVFTYRDGQAEEPVPPDFSAIIKLVTESYERRRGALPQSRFFLPIHVQQVDTDEIQIFICTVTKEEQHYRISIVVHETAFPKPPASIANNRYRYLIKLMDTYEADENGSLEQFVNSHGLSYRQVQSDSRKLFGSTFYHHYLKIKMIPALEDLLFSTLSYKQIAYKNGFSSYHQLYTQFHKTYRFPFYTVPRLALEQ